ncbi:peptidoglycan editing factor PgeF [Mariprofundus erugo]|uniref:peptidoglycan editing factor PgeF n=1 Tax=Mariprofundus erugo TaxID=2528639 RepID=UPI0010FD19AF|nr:peptidoglycan editing factor PgeF [Mariprofundus erugo]TLS76426.1 peptidoglycan editing factor PgeF [Mariprofundus erugo]
MTASADKTACGLIRSQLLLRHGILGFFTTRGGGVSPPPFDSLNFATDSDDAPDHIRQNIDIISAEAPLPCPPHQARQVHKSDLIWCAGYGHMHQIDADILLSRDTDAPVAVRTADCLPVLLADPQSRIVAAVHAGWRGTADTVVRAAVTAMVEQGARPERILASLGPCIGPCCFEIGEDAADKLAASSPGAENQILTHPLRADLAAINRLQLLDCGIIEPHIECSFLCTVCHPDQFYSFRRDGHHSGRQLAVVAIPSST